MKKPDLSTFAKILLAQSIRRADGTTISIITSRTGMSLRQASVAMDELTEEGLIQFQDGRLSVTPKGREWAMGHQDAFAFSGTKSWREIPTEFSGPSLSCNEPYAPRRSKLDPKF